MIEMAQSIERDLVLGGWIHFWLDVFKSLNNASEECVSK